MQQKYAKNIHVSLRLEFFDLIGEIVKSRFPCEYKNNTSEERWSILGKRK